MEVFLESTEATPCGHLLNWKFTPENPLANTMFMAAMVMVLPWKIVEDFQSLVKSTKLWPSLMFYKSFGQTIYWSTAKPWTSPKKCSNDLERSKFCQQVQSFVCVPPLIRVTFKFWEMLKNASEVTLVLKNICFLKMLNFLQISFVECKVSLTDGTSNFVVY
jgi:hypothetical protein